MERLSVFCADVGSIKQGNFGWAHAEVPAGDRKWHPHSTEIRELVDAIATDLAGGLPVALGFECPLFVPVPEDPMRLGSGRPGEGSRSFSAGAGPGALVTGLVQMSWVLAELRARRPFDRGFVEWQAFEEEGGDLFLWEAFVTAEAKALTHVDDATAAVRCFCEALPDPRTANAVTAERPLSLVGTAAIWAGWSSDVSLLHDPCLVIKAGLPVARPE